MVRLTARALLLAVMLVGAGCQGLFGPSGPPSDPQAVEAIDRAERAALNATAYRYAIDGRVQLRRNSRLRAVDITGHGVVDLERQQVNSTVRTRGDTAAADRDTRVAYVDGYTLDVSCERVGWARHNLTESTRWFNYTTLGRQLALLDRATVYWNGTEIVNGDEVAVVTAYPTENQLQRSNNLPTGTVGTSGGAKFQNATVRAWIDAETGRIRKVQREIHVRAGESTGVASITYRFSGYDDPATVTRPAFDDYGPQMTGGCVDA